MTSAATNIRVAPARIDAAVGSTNVTLPRARSNRLGGRVRAAICTALYYGVARHLPRSSLPYTVPIRHIRYTLCRRMFRCCGRNVNVEHGAFVNSGRGVEIGDDSGIGVDAYIIGPVTIGSNVMMGPRCMLIALDHEVGCVEAPMIAQGVRIAKPPIIEDDVWLGANVTVLPGRRIGTGSVVGAGAVVASDIPAHAIAAGNPARVVRYRETAAHSAPAGTNGRS